MQLVGRFAARGVVVFAAACLVAGIAYAAVSLFTDANAEAPSNDATLSLAAGINVLVREIALIGATALFGRKVLRLRL
jgi:hypothetical protein